MRAARQRRVSHSDAQASGAQQSSPDFFGAYFFAMHESSRAQPFLLRSFQCFPARTSSQYLHLVLARVFFGVFLRRRAQKFLNFEWRLRAGSACVRRVKDGWERARRANYGMWDSPRDRGPRGPRSQ